jgi:hypothetical protein
MFEVVPGQSVGQVKLRLDAFWHIAKSGIVDVRSTPDDPLGFGSRHCAALVAGLGVALKQRTPWGDNIAKSGIYVHANAGGQLAQAQGGLD